MKQNLKGILIVSLTLPLILFGFQNCSKAEFSDATGGSIEKSSLVAMELDENDSDEEGTGEILVPGSDDGTRKNPPAHGHRPPEPEEPEQGEEQAIELYACILNKHGKSLKLGLVEEKLEGVNSVAQSVCMSENACLNLVSQKFDVQGVYSRGYCNGNPNVARLSDAEIAELLK